MKKRILLIALSLCLCAAVAVGAAGCDGSGGTVWYSGTDAPTAQTEGNVGDFYLDEDDFDIYKRTESGWELIGNIKGADGAAGQKGDTGAAGQDGQDGAPGADGEDGQDGANGADGQTPYIGENGNWWIGDKDTGVKAEGQDGADGAPGAPGADGEDGKDGQDGRGVANIEITYSYNEEGREVIVFTIHYTDETVETVTVEVPRKILYINYLGGEQYEVIGEGEEPPKMMLRVEYEDGYEEIPVTEEMFVVDGVYRAVDFYTPGLYRVKIVYQGYMAYEGEIRVIDWSDDSFVSAYISEPYAIMRVQDGELAVDFTNITFTAMRANGDVSIWGLDDSSLEKSYEFTGEGVPFDITVTYTEGEDSVSAILHVLPLSDDAMGEVAWTDATYYGEQGYTVNLGDEPFYGHEYIRFAGNVGGQTYIYNMPVSAELLVDEWGGPFDSAATGTKTYYFDAEKVFGKDIKTSINVTVVDPSDTSVTGIWVNAQRVIALVEEGNLVKDYTGLQITATLANGAELQLSPSDVEIDLSSYTAAGEMFTVFVRYEGVETQFEVIPLTSEQLYDGETVKFWGAQYWGEWELTSAIGEEPFVNGEFIQLDGDWNGYPCAYALPARAELLLDFDKSAAGEGEYYFDSEKLFGTYAGSVRIRVYDPDTVTVDSISVDGTTVFGVGQGSYDGWMLRVHYSTGEGYSFQETVPFDESMIVDDDGLDFGVRGEYTILVEYEGIQTPVAVTVYDPEVFNIKYIDLAGLYNLEMPLNTDVETFLAENVVGRTFYVTYYEPVDGLAGETISITREMLDASAVNGEQTGMYAIRLTYGLPGQEAYTCTINVSVSADLAGKEPIAIYYLDENAAKMLGSEQVELYEGNVLVIGSMQAAYTEEGDLLRFAFMGSEVIFRKTVEEDRTVLSAYIPNGEGVQYSAEYMGMMITAYEEENIFVLANYVAGGEPAPVMSCTGERNDSGYWVIIGQAFELIPPEEPGGIGTATAVMVD